MHLARSVSELLRGKKGTACCLQLRWTRKRATDRRRVERNLTANKETQVGIVSQRRWINNNIDQFCDSISYWSPGVLFSALVNLLPGCCYGYSTLASNSGPWARAWEKKTAVKRQLYERWPGLCMKTRLELTLKCGEQQLVGMRISRFTFESRQSLYQSKVNSSLISAQRLGHKAHYFKRDFKSDFTCTRNGGKVHFAKCIEV